MDAARFADQRDALTDPTAPEADGDAWAVPLFPSASDELERQGFARVINHGETRARVTVSAFDESDRAYDPLTLTVGGRKTVHFNSDDLELGNEAKGLSASAGEWRLEPTGGRDMEALFFVRTKEGYLTSMPGPPRLAAKGRVSAGVNPEVTNSARPRPCPAVMIMPQPAPPSRFYPEIPERNQKHR